MSDASQDEEASSLCGVDAAAAMLARFATERALVEPQPVPTLVIRGSADGLVPRALVSARLSSMNERGRHVACLQGQRRLPAPRAFPACNPRWQPSPLKRDASRSIESNAVYNTFDVVPLVRPVPCRDHRPVLLPSAPCLPAVSNLRRPSPAGPRSRHHRPRRLPRAALPAPCQRAGTEGDGGVDHGPLLTGCCVHDSLLDAAMLTSIIVLAVPQRAETTASTEAPGTGNCSPIQHTSASRLPRGLLLLSRQLEPMPMNGYRTWAASRAACTCGLLLHGSP